MLDYEALIEKSKTELSGNSCLFVKIKRLLGIKIYKSRYMRDFSFNNQKMCFDIGLAPKVGECVDLAYDRFAYTTETIKVLVKITDSWKRNHTKHTKIFPQYHFQMLEVVNAIREKTEFEFTDWQWSFNWGIKNGQLMPLDFGM